MMPTTLGLQMRGPSQCISFRSNNTSNSRRNSVVTCSVQAPETTSTATDVDKDQPDWTGETFLSNVVNAAIGNKFLFGIMKLGARSAIKGTAEKQGVPWEQTVDELQKSEVYQIREEIEDKTLEYPSYYTQPFHGYDQGNLNWQAAFEVEPATAAMAIRVWKNETDLSPDAAQARLRGGIYQCVREFAKRHNVAQNPRAILDIGCSVGVSTRYLAEEYPDAHVTGLDMSPHFLAVAELRERQLGGGGGTRQRIKFVHGDMLNTKLPDGSFDMITVQFVIHECPEWVIKDLVAECKRLVRPGGMLVIVDNNPKSKVIQNLPPVLFTLMKSTEPWSDSYYSTDLEGIMRETGFKGVVTEESDPRHRTVMAYV